MSNIIEKIKEIVERDQFELEIYAEVDKEEFKKIIKTIKSLKFKKISSKLLDSVEYANYREELRELIYRKRNKRLTILYHKEYFRNGIYYYIKYIKLEKKSKEKRNEKKEEESENANDIIISFPNHEIFNKIYESADTDTKKELEKLLRDHKIKIY